MPANHFVLRHHNIEVDYIVGITPGLPALTYSDGNSSALSFTDADITTDKTALGTLVSVSLLKTVDTGGERFGFVLPELDVPQGRSGRFETVGVYERFSGPDTVPPVPPSWRGIKLQGTARTVIVPL
jgi:hypothetical protein